MAIETERKFLVRSDAWRAAVTSSTRMRQGYIASAPDRTVRLRIAGDAAWLTCKFGPAGPSREEFEYSVPVADAEAMLVHAAGEVSKTRHIVPWHDLAFEIDMFHGALEGLVLAELETERAFDRTDLPGWIGREVTDDPRYYNAVLVREGLPREGK